MKKRCVLQCFLKLRSPKHCKSQRFAALDAKNIVFYHVLATYEAQAIEKYSVSKPWMQKTLRFAMFSPPPEPKSL